MSSISSAVDRNRPRRRLRLAAVGGAVAAAVAQFGLVGSVSAASLSPANHQACGQMFWTNRHWIGRADLNGTDVDQRLVPRAAGFFATGIAAASGHIYWGDPGGSMQHLPKPGQGTIVMADADGTHVVRRFITGASLPAGIAVAGRYIYWSNNLTGTIGRALRNGTDVDQAFITTAQRQGPDGLAVGSGHIYWANDYGIGRADLNGTHVNQSFIPVPNGPSGVSGIAVNARYIYWNNEAVGHIGRARLNGTGVNQRFITGAHFPEVGLVATPRYLYWANDDSSTIGRALLNGTQVNERYITVARQNLYSLAVQPPCGTAG